jgi:demethylmenaquinone methyltransferase/2-methoxy-6-polyprenyl-1,4-benzoquinol methylase
MEEKNDIAQNKHKAAMGSMFDNIAVRYDFLNHLLSFGIDRIWRAKAIRMLYGRYSKPCIIDVAAGTGELSVISMRLDPMHVKGIDISEKMLERGKTKIIRKGFNDKIELLYGDSENIPFNENTFDIAMAAFGVRNFSDTRRGLSEMKRVLRTNGTIMVLEFSKPVKFPFKQLYFLYFTRLLPVIGRVFSRNTVAYRYLPESVMQFLDNEQFISLLGELGFSDISQKRMTGGIVSVYTGIKKAEQ